MAKIQGADIKTVAELISAGASAASLPLDSQVYVGALSINKTLNQAITDGDIGAGGTTGVITKGNSNFDVTVGSWLAYADVGAVPVDGTGGSPTLTVTRTTTTPLRGNGSLLLTKDAANRQGEGGSLLLTVEPKFRGKPLKLSFAYEASANFSYASQASDVQVFIYDVTNSALLSPNSIFLDGSGYYAGSIQLPTNTASIRVILHVATVNALAWTLEADDFDLDLNANEFVDSQSDWLAYTPVLQGFGTITSPEIYYRQNGPDTEIQAKFTCGTVAASEAQFGLPLGRSVASIISTVQQVGSLTVKATTSGNFDYPVLATAGDTFLNFAIKSGTNDGLTPLNGNVAFSNSIVVSFYARVPTSGLTSGYAHPAAIGLNAQTVFSAYKSGGSAFTGDVAIPSWTATQIDTVGAFNATTGLYTVRTPGNYFVSWQFRQTASTTGSASILVNGVTARAGTTNNTGDSKQVTGVIENLKYGDTIAVSSTVSATLATGTVFNTFSLFRIGSEAQPYAPRIAYAKHQVAANTAGGSSTSGGWETRTLNTLLGDTSFVSRSGNQLTLQPGTYHVHGWAVHYHAANTGTGKCRFRNITAGTTAIVGLNARNAVDDTGTSMLTGTFSISVASIFEMQYRVFNSQATSGYGLPINWGEEEVYVDVKITKVL